jgi:hypothetical protein
MKNIKIFTLISLFFLMVGCSHKVYVYKTDVKTEKK